MSNSERIVRLPQGAIDNISSAMALTNFENTVYKIAYALVRMKVPSIHIIIDPSALGFTISVPTPSRFDLRDPSCPCFPLAHLSSIELTQFDPDNNVTTFQHFRGGEVLDTPSPSITSPPVAGHCTVINAKELFFNLPLRQHCENHRPAYQARTETRKILVSLSLANAHVSFSLHGPDHRLMYSCIGGYLTEERIRASFRNARPLQWCPIEHPHIHAGFIAREGANSRTISMLSIGGRIVRETTWIQPVIGKVWKSYAAKHGQLNRSRFPAFVINYNGDRRSVRYFLSSKKDKKEGERQLEISVRAALLGVTRAEVEEQMLEKAAQLAAKAELKRKRSPTPEKVKFLNRFMYRKPGDSAGDVGENTNLKDDMEEIMRDGSRVKQLQATDQVDNAEDQGAVDEGEDEEMTPQELADSGVSKQLEEPKPRSDDDDDAGIDMEAEGPVVILDKPPVRQPEKSPVTVSVDWKWAVKNQKTSKELLEERKRGIHIYKPTRTEMRQGGPVKMTKSKIPTMKALHQMQNKIIVVTDGDGFMYGVDQHAISERFMYEALMKSATPDQVRSYRLPSPIEVDLSDEHRIVALLQKSILETWGWKLEIFEDNVKMICVPYLTKLERLVNSEKELCSYLEKDLSVRPSADKIPTPIQQAIATSACHSSVKFNQKLTLAQCQSLVDALSECDEPFTCAHGRPAFVPVAKFF